jgi:hypothetical protein
MYFKAKRLMRKGNYDLVYGHLHEGALIGIWLKNLFNKKAEQCSAFSLLVNV